MGTPYKLYRKMSQRIFEHEIIHILNPLIPSNRKSTLCTHVFMNRNQTYNPYNDLNNSLKSNTQTSLETQKKIKKPQLN